MKYPALPKFTPGIYRVFVWFWVNDAWRRAPVGSVHSEQEARDLIEKDVKAMRETYGGLIRPLKGPRVYRVYKTETPKQVGTDDLYIE